MFKRKWKPSASQKKAFAEKMKDPEEQAAYLQRKEDRAEKRRAGSRFNYSTAGGNYMPTEGQYKEALRFIGKGDLTQEQFNACNIVMSAWVCQEKCHHDQIHVVNELTRNRQNYEYYNPGESY